MIKKPKTCLGCPLWGTGQGFSEPEGSGALGVLIVGEALGFNEEKMGKPFVKFAESGAVLERVLRKAGYAREQFALWNIVACRPPNNKLEGEKYETAAINHCRTHFDSIMRRFQPRVVFGLGNVPLKALTGHAGPKQTVTHMRGFALPMSDYAGTTYVGSFHPSYVNRGNRKLTGVLIRDLQYAVQISQHGLPRPLALAYDCFPSIGDAWSYYAMLKDNPGLPIAFDIETPRTKSDNDEDEYLYDNSRPDQIQFSHKPGQAIIFPWSGEFVTVAKAILALPNEKWTQNGWAFDNPILEANGATINGPVHDFMWMWWQLQSDLPKHLQFIASFYCPEIGPWKHQMGADIQTYGGKDVDSLQRIGQQIFKDLDAAGLREIYERHTRQVWPILAAMAKRGLPIDIKAQGEFATDIASTKAKLAAEAQALVPPGLKKTRPYKGVPTEPRALAKAELAVPQQMTVVRAGEEVLIYQDAEGIWYQQKPFNLNSSQQILAYIRHRGHPVPKAVGEDRESTGGKQLEALWRKTKDPLYKAIIEHKQLEKMKDFIWHTDPDGRVRTQFGFGTGSGQLTSQRPNLMQVPSPKGESQNEKEQRANELATRLRSTIKARPGHMLVEADLASAHAVTMGYESGDKGYLRAARCDIHSYLTAHMLHLPEAKGLLALPDKELIAALAAIKKTHAHTRGKKAKPAILGAQFGLGGDKLYEMYDENFASRSEARGILRMLGEVFPGVQAYKGRIKLQAHRQGFLRSRHGYVRRFWDALSYSYRTSEWKSGSQAEAALAFEASNDAHGHLREVMLDLEAQGLNEKYRLILTVHDSLLFECPIALVDECILSVAQAMEKPNPFLEGLRFGCEVTKGPDWAHMTKAYQTNVEDLL